MLLINELIIHMTVCFTVFSPSGVQAPPGRLPSSRSSVSLLTGTAPSTEEARQMAANSTRGRPGKPSDCVSLQFLPSEAMLSLVSVWLVGSRLLLSVEQCLPLAVAALPSLRRPHSSGLPLGQPQA